MDFLVYTYLTLFFGIFPLSACLLIDKYQEHFRGGRVLIAILLYSLLSWGITIGVIYLRYLLDPMSLRGPEWAFALFFGGIYLWITSIPVFLIYSAARIIFNLLKRKKSTQ